MRCSTDGRDKIAATSQGAIGESIHRIAAREALGPVDLQPHQHRVVVGGAEGDGAVQIRRGALRCTARRVFGFDVVIQIDRLIGINVPLVSGDQVRAQRRIAERMVQRAGETSEHVGVGIVDERIHAARAQPVDGVFLFVGVEVAERDHPWRAGEGADEIK